MNNKKFAVLNHQYSNAGGNTMVTVAAVYLKENKATQYCIASGEGWVLSTVDYINADYSIEDLSVEQNELIVDYGLYEDIKKCKDKDFRELLYQCWYQYIIDCSKYYGAQYIDAENCPPQLLKMLPEGYAQWLNKNELLITIKNGDIDIDGDYLDVSSIIDDTVEKHIDSAFQEVSRKLKVKTGDMTPLLHVRYTKAVYELKHIVAEWYRINR